MPRNKFAEPFDDILGGEPTPKPVRTIHESELVQLIGLSRAQIVMKAQAGILTRVAPATYALPDVVRAYCDHLRGVAARSGGRPPAGGDNALLAAQKLRLTVAQADKEETRVARERGELVSAVEVEREWTSILRDVRSTMMAVPSRVGANLPHLTPHDLAEIDREIKSALGSLSDGN